MSKKIFFSALAILLMVSGFGLPEAAAAAPNKGEGTNVSLLDPDFDGKINEIRVAFYNGTDTWSADCSLGAACGFAVTQNGQPVDIINVSLDSGVMNYPAIIISLDANDLVKDTQGVTTNPIELTYSPAGAACGDTLPCVHNDVGDELLEIRVGDADTVSPDGYSNNREDDYASPIVTLASPSDGARTVPAGKVLTYDFSEPMYPSALVWGDDYECWESGSSIPPPGNWDYAWSNGNKRLQLTHDDFELDYWYTCNLYGGITIDANEELHDDNAMAYQPLVNYSHEFLTGVPSSGGAELPRNMSVKINEGAAETETTAVVLSLWADYSPEMMISNSSTFSGAVWEPFSTSKEWTLTSGGGEKTVYVKYRNVEQAESETVTDTILLLGEPAADEEISGDEPAPFMDFTAGRFIKSADNTAVYFLDAADVRHVYVHYNVWHSYFGDDWSRVEVIADDEMAGYSLGDNVPFKTGSLMKVPTNPKVYEVADYYMIHWVVDEAVAAARYGAGWASLIYDLPVGFFGDYVEGEALGN